VTPAVVTARLGAWLDELPALLAALDPATGAFCRASLRRVVDEDLLARKVEAELGARRWAPVGSVLVVVSENDVLGTAFALLGACATGNRIRIKARRGRALIESLARALGLDGDACEILDWDGRAQDDAAILDGIDAVLLAGGDELIRRYRRAAPAHVRLIEWGPKLSAAAIGAGADVGGPAGRDPRVAPLTQFEHRVCN
jgi:hypothetical protein